MLAERVVGMEKRGIFVENFARMKLLKERILADGKCFEGGILKVDNFINHQMDPTLMHAMAQELATRIIAKTKCSKIQNQTRLFDLKGQSKRNATRI